MAKRWGSIVVVVAVAALGLGISAPPASAATGVITPATSSVAAGRTLKFRATGCEDVVEEDDDHEIYRSADIGLIVGTGAGERLAGLPIQTSDTGFSMVVPRWVDPSLPVVLGGSCIEQTYDFETGDETSSTLFTYADVAVDVTAPTGPLNSPVVVPNRTTAAGGQVIRVTGSGCQTYEGVQVVSRAGAGLGRPSGVPDYAAFGTGDVAADGTFTVDLALNREDFSGEDLEGTPNGSPLEEGAYAVLVVCTHEDEDEESAPRFVLAEPFAIDVVGTRPSEAISLTTVPDSDDVLVSGSGCTGGAEVTLHLTGFADVDGFEEFDRHRLGALRTGDLAGAARATRAAPPGQIEETHTVTPAADGTWSFVWAAPGNSYSLQVAADCGDPAGDGFRYLDVHRFDFSFSDLYVDRISPTSSPVGGEVTIHAEGECEDGDAAVAIVDRDGNVLDSAPVTFDEWMVASGTVTAPSAPGSYYVTGTCGGDLGEPMPYEVFTPTPVAGAALPAEPTTGWPSEGARETYHGKIGPITLRADDGGMGMEDQVAKALGSSGYFVDVPRPEGDFAITKLDFDLVDADGMAVPQTDAHLHHFVIGNTSAKNPACPDSTFGLPGQIVGAAGAERTVLDLPDPYGIVVKGTDDWTGVYDLMGMADHDQTVYLTYDLDLRRDVQNVRPVTTYFGSATGCDSFSWTIDGSGTPDVQSHYLTIAKAGRLVGTGAHIHNGGMHTELVDDRDRVLCRSTLELGDMPMHHGSTMSRRPPTRVDEATTTEGVGEPVTDGYPPEFYDDDLEIAGINGCHLDEAVVAGERLRFDAVYENERARSGVMGIFTAYVWEGGGPAEATGPSGATPIPGSPDYTG